ncbi:Rha family transcriptional regulator [Salinisphaera sp. LB1]|uniref:Rha family transcriptional regulator n=1 Tax=Salinisphaera sp. LB1 TaxID=2183911 RepID=UPI000D705BFA|nr:phage regulatory protein/antirepressor Ant [Salinisphaera sp. LB1]
MNLVTINNQSEPVTTSLALAEGVRKDHSSIIKLVREYASDINEFGNSRFEIQNSSGAGRPTEYAVLNEPQATLILSYMRNNDIVREFKKRLVGEFYRMRDQLAAHTHYDASSLSRMDILRLAMDSEQRRLELEDRNRHLSDTLERAKPAIEIARSVIASDDLLTVRQAAQVLGTGRNRLFKFLRDHGWVNQYNQPFQKKIELKYLDYKISSFRKGDQLCESIVTMVTGKGLAKLQRALNAQ